jgi:hypothetical protein
MAMARICCHGLPEEANRCHRDDRLGMEGDRAKSKAAGYHYHILNLSIQRNWKRLSKRSSRHRRRKGRRPRSKIVNSAPQLPSALRGDDVSLSAARRSMPLRLSSATSRRVNWDGVFSWKLFSPWNLALDVFWRSARPFAQRPLSLANSLEFASF